MCWRNHGSLPTLAVQHLLGPPLKSFRQTCVTTGLSPVFPHFPGCGSAWEMTCHLLQRAKPGFLKYSPRNSQGSALAAWPRPLQHRLRAEQEATLSHHRSHPHPASQLSCSLKEALKLRLHTLPCKFRLDGNIFLRKE